MLQFEQVFCLVFFFFWFADVRLSSAKSVLTSHDLRAAAFSRHLWMNVRGLGFTGEDEAQSYMPPEHFANTPFAASQ